MNKIVTNCCCQNLSNGPLLTLVMFCFLFKQFALTICSQPPLFTTNKGIYSIYRYRYSISIRFESRVLISRENDVCFLWDGECGISQL